MSKRAVLYARVSSDDRANDGRNLKGQLEMGREYARKHGYAVVGEIMEDIRGATGVSLELEGVERALEMAEAGEYDVLVVREIDRFARFAVKWLILEEQLKLYGVAVEYILEDYPDTPEGGMMKTFKAAVAEYEAKKIVERMNRGRRQVVKSGRVLLHGKNPPYGYRLSEDGTNLVVHEPEARIVRLIFSWYVDGDESGKKLAMRKIAARLTDMGIPTWADIHGTKKKSGYAEWCWAFIRQTLMSETYKGDWHYGRYNSRTGTFNPRSHWLTVKVPAIVSRDVWDRAQKQRRLNATFSKRNIKRQYLLRYRARCGHCGSTFGGYSIASRGKVYRYYRCHGYLGNVVNVECDLPGFRVDQVDAAVWAWVREQLLDPARLERGLSDYRAKRDQEHAPLRARLDVVHGLIADHRTQLERLLDLYLAGDFAKEMLVERKTRLETTIDALERERDGLVATLEAKTLTQRQIRTIRQFAAEVAKTLDIAGTSFEARRRVIELLNVQATLAIEDGEKVIHARGYLGKGTLVVGETTTRGRMQTGTTK